MSREAYQERSVPFTLDGNEFVLTEWLDTHYNLSGEYLTCGVGIGFKPNDDRHDKDYVDYFIHLRYVVPIGPALPYSMFSGSPSNMGWNKKGTFITDAGSSGKKRLDADNWDDALAIMNDFRALGAKAYKDRVAFLQSLKE